MNAPLAILPFAVVALLAGCAWAQTIEGRVVGVHDGDSITVLNGAKVQHKVRLYGIDAPEDKQAFGDRAQQALSRLSGATSSSPYWNGVDGERGN